MGTKSDRAIALTAKCITQDGEHAIVEISFTIKNDAPLRILRRCVDFDVSADAENYFCGLTPEGGETVFSGIPEKQGSRVRLLDADVSVGETYAYFAVSGDGEGVFVGPAPVRVRDPYIYYSHARILEKEKQLAERFGGSLTTLGETVGHKPLVALSVGNPDRTVALLGAVHAGEAGAELCLGVIERIAASRPDLLSKTGLVTLPSVNADERERMVTGNPWYLRTNRNGVDINRNFDAKWETVGYSYGVSTDDPTSSTYRGPYPSSEPETRAVVSLLSRFSPIAAISYHDMYSITGDSMYLPRSAEGDAAFAQRAERIARPYKEGFREPIGYPMNKVLFYAGSAGGFPEYCYRNGTVGFDVEHWASGLTNLEGRAGDKTTRALLDECISLHTSALVRLLEQL